MSAPRRTPRELDDRALEAMVEKHIEGAADPMCVEWLNACMERYGTRRVAEAVRANSRDQLLPLIHLTQDIFGIMWEPQIVWLALPSPYFAASAMRVEGHYVVVVHEGLLTLLRLWSTQRLVIAGAAAASGSEAERENMGRAVVACCLGLSLAFMEKPIRLPRWDWRLPKQQRITALQIYVGMLAFVLAHELSHHRLGHSSGGLKFSPADRQADRHLLLHEELYFTKVQEFEADGSALSCALKSPELYLLGAHAFLDNLASMQSILGHKTKTHPFASNRLAELRKGLRKDTPKPILREFEKSARWAEDYRKYEELGRDDAIAGFRVDVPRAHATLDAAVGQMFGFDYKLDLIRDLLREYCADLAGEELQRECGRMVEEMDEITLLNSGMAAIVTITENFAQHRYFGLPTSEALARIDEDRAESSGTPRCHASNLEDFIKQRLAIEHPGFAPAPARLKHAIERTQAYFTF